MYDCNNRTSMDRDRQINAVMVAVNKWHYDKIPPIDNPKDISFPRWAGMVKRVLTDNGIRFL